MMMYEILKRGQKCPLFVTYIELSTGMVMPMTVFMLRLLSALHPVNKSSKSVVLLQEDFQALQLVSEGVNQGLLLCNVRFCL